MNLEILRHTDRGDNGIEGEYHIDDDDLDDYPKKTRWSRTPRHFSSSRVSTSA